MIFSKIIKAIYPDNAAARKPSKYSGRFSEFQEKSVKFKSEAPKTEGMLRRNEKANASFWRMFWLRAVVMVEPERDNPGMIAKA